MSRKQQHEQTHQRLLEATVRCLVEHGYAGTTTQRVQDEAQVSRGALLHHFGSKSQLFVAAIQHIADGQLAEIQDVAGRLSPGNSGVRTAVEALRSAMSGPLFLSGMELWIGARTDEVLREALLPAERRLGAALRETLAGVLGGDDAHARTAYESLLVLLRGLAITSVLRENPRVADDILDLWSERVLANAAPVAPPDEPAQER